MVSIINKNRKKKVKGKSGKTEKDGRTDDFTAFGYQGSGIPV